ncbi:type II toxin-antitoxin system PemK/MazF family toxin [Candidatus Saccharibacteria bacterium]|nr:type II toxin-antitoxin system PemK/MazF family toxin [Candidatus Saccharibacteria bacterium]
MDKNGNKNFKGWIKVKERLHYNGQPRNIKNGEVWWGSVGENVGVEICGKGKTYTRPVIVFKKLNNRSFWAIPLTSKQHFGNWYVSFDFQNNNEIAALSQIHCMSTSRLHRRMGQLSQSDYNLIFEAFLKLLLEDKKMRPRLLWGKTGKSRQCTLQYIYNYIKKKLKVK